MEGESWTRRRGGGVCLKRDKSLMTADVTPSRRVYRTCDVPEFAQTVVLEAADAVALFALVTGLQVTEHERADDHVTGDQGEQAQVAEQVREELAHAPAEPRFRRGVRDGWRWRQQRRRHRRCRRCRHRCTRSRRHHRQRVTGATGLTHRTAAMYRVGVRAAAVVLPGRRHSAGRAKIW